MWIFHGEGGRFASGVFTTHELALSRIKKHRVTGLLTAYPADEGAYDLASRTCVFTSKSDKHRSSRFIGAFTSASQPHEHCESGSESGSVDAGPARS